MHDTSSALSAFDIAAILVVASALLGWFNHHFIKLPHVIGLTVMGALTAIGLMIAMCLFGAMIEFVQIYFPQRTVSLNDLLAQWAGGLLGIILWFLLGGRISHWVRSLWQEHAQDRLAVKILFGYLVFVVIYQLLPFDLTISPVEVYHKFKEGKIALVPFRQTVVMVPYTLGTKIAIMIPVGFLFALLCSKRKQTLWIATFYSLVFVGLIEFLQLFVYSRYSSSTDVMFGLIGAGAGVRLSDLFGPAARHPVVGPARADAQAIFHVLLEIGETQLSVSQAQLDF